MCFKEGLIKLPIRKQLQKVNNAATRLVVFFFSSVDFENTFLYCLAKHAEY